MRLYRVLPLLLLLGLVAAPAIAQGGKIVFAETNHSFGNLQDGDEARHVFTFRNEGSAPLRLVNVVPACGCTTPHWSKEALAPGASGQIEVVYDAEGHPGAFERTVDVYSDGEPERIILTIQGMVQPRALENPVAFGSLLIETPEANLGVVTSGENAVHTFRVQNDGEGPLRITEIKSPSDNVFVTFPARTLQPGNIEWVTVIVDTEPLTVHSAFDYLLPVTTSDPAQPETALRLSGLVETASSAP